MLDSKSLHIALIQQRYKGSRAAMLKSTSAMVERAAKNGAKLIALQELHTSEYFCQSEDTKYFKYANYFEADIAYFGALAKKLKVVLITSLFEKRSAGMYHNTAVVFEKDGKIAGKYRKMHIPDDPQFYEKFYFTPGDLGFEPIDTSVGKLGVLICWDQWYPEAARIMALKGADMLIYPTAIGYLTTDSKLERTKQLESWIAIQRAHSIANALPTMAINRVGIELDSTDKTKKRGIEFFGSSFIFDARGVLLAKGSESKEAIIEAKLNLNASDEVRTIWPFLRDRRIESYGDLLKRFCDQEF